MKIIHFLDKCASLDFFLTMTLSAVVPWQVLNMRMCKENV